MAGSQTDSVSQSGPLAQRLKQLVVPALIPLMAVGILFLIAGNWNTWPSERASQETDDAYVRADTKVAGLVATVAVSGNQPAKAGDLLEQLRDDDGEDTLINNQRQKELQNAYIPEITAIARYSYRNGVPFVDRSASVQVERSYNKVERPKQMVHVANEVAGLRAEGQRAPNSNKRSGARRDFSQP
jgi:multidrug resistance efflux pump